LCGPPPPDHPVPSCARTRPFQGERIRKAEVEPARSAEPGEGNGAGLPVESVLAALKPLLEDPAVLKIGAAIKSDWLLFARHGIALAPLDDTMLMSYALDSGARAGHGMEGLCKDILAHDPAFKPAPTTPAALAKAAKAKAASLDLTPDPPAAAAESADITLRLWSVLKPRLTAERVTGVYERLERPLVPVLARMERRGIKVDRPDPLAPLRQVRQKAAGLEAEIFDMAGQSFNIGSPKQLGDILFGKLGLPGRQEDPHRPVVHGRQGSGRPRRRRPAAAQEDRRMAPAHKLKSTYTDSLPLYMDPENRIHTNYAMARRRRGGSPPPSQICKTYPSARRKAAPSAPPLSPRTGTSSFPPITARSSCACSPTWRISRSSPRPSPMGSTSTP
jgi:DNA polymerase-1